MYLPRNPFSTICYFYLNILAILTLSRQVIHKCESLNLLHTSICVYYQENISSRFSRNSETNADSYWQQLVDHGQLSVWPLWRKTPVYKRLTKPLPLQHKKNMKCTKAVMSRTMSWQRKLNIIKSIELLDFNTWQSSL